MKKFLSKNNGSKNGMWKGGFPHCIDCNKILHKYTAIRCRKCFYLSRKGKKTWSFGRKREKAPNWKGNKVKYQGLHSWIRRNYGDANHCDFCNTLTAKKYEWSNKNHLYRRDIKEWQQLCTKCHMRYDREVLYAR